MVMFWFKVDTISSDVHVNVRVQNIVCSCVVMCTMAQSKEALDFLPVELFTTILHKLATHEFASETLSCHSAIRRQIESLLQSPAELQSLSIVFKSSLFSSRTVATAPLISSVRDSSYSDELSTSCARCGPNEKKYSGSTQSSTDQREGGVDRKSPLWLALMVL